MKILGGEFLVSKICENEMFLKIYGFPDFRALPISCTSIFIVSLERIFNA